MSIITKRGDQGSTDLLFNKKAPKHSERIEALGAVDELNAHLGLARVHAGEGDLALWIDEIQKLLISLMGELATAEEDYQRYLDHGFGTIDEQDIIDLELLAQKHEQEGNTFKGWLRPGADLLTAQLHVCRTVCRRAERRTWALPLVSRAPSLFLNRLADVLWLLTSSPGH